MGSTPGVEAYDAKDIFEVQPDTWQSAPPTFENVVDVVQRPAGTGTQKAAAQGLLSRITPFVTLKLFTGQTTMPFEQLVKAKLYAGHAGCSWSASVSDAAGCTTQRFVQSGRRTNHLADCGVRNPDGSPRHREDETERIL